jgi:hypothetical protein
MGFDHNVVEDEDVRLGARCDDADLSFLVERDRIGGCTAGDGLEGTETELVHEHFHLACVPVSVGSD